MPSRRWQAAVAGSAAIVVLVVLVTGVGWLATRQSKTTSYSVSAPLSRVELALSSGQAVIVGTQSSTLEVRRTDKYSFGHAAREQRSLTDGVLRISSRCALSAPVTARLYRRADGRHANVSPAEGDRL